MGFGGVDLLDPVVGVNLKGVNQGQGGGVGGGGTLGHFFFQGNRR